MVDCTAQSSDPELTLHKTTVDSIVKGPDTRTYSGFSDTEPPVKKLRFTAKGSATPSRRRSIRKHIGRFLLHFSRTSPSDTYNEYVYQYKGNASELPAGGVPIEGSAPIQEMPASFANLGTFELEQPQSYDMNSCRFVMSPLYDESHRNFCPEFRKPSYTGELALYRDSSHIATPKQLPRLAVPRTVHDIPSMVADQSPISPATISPNTPIGYMSNSMHPYTNSQPALHLVSPCDKPDASPSYSGPRPQYHCTQHNLGSPMTKAFAGSSSVTTPSSAHSLSSHASFDAWPQPKLEYLRSAFPQRYQPINHEPSTYSTPSTGPNAWIADFDLHPYHHRDTSLETCYQAAAHDVTMSLEPPLHSPDYDFQRTEEKPLHGQLQHPSEAYECDTDMHLYHLDDEAPPAYSPVIANTEQYLPAVCQHCGKSFTGKYGSGNLKRHIRQIHEFVMGGTIHICRLCMKTYNRADALRKHSWKKHRQEDARPNKRRR